MNLKLTKIIKIHNRLQRKILLFGEACLPENKFQAFRKLVIESFGHGGAKDDLCELFDENKIRYEHKAN
jgi:hypothetical protein